MCISKWTNLPKGNLAHQWPLWGTFEIPKLIKRNWTIIALKFLKLNGTPIINWYFEDSKCYQEPKIASLQNKILRATEANKQLKKD